MCLSSSSCKNILFLDVCVFLNADSCYFCAGLFVFARFVLNVSPRAKYAEAISFEKKYKPAILRSAYIIR